MNKDFAFEISHDRVLEICQIISEQGEEFFTKTRTQKAVVVIYLLLMQGNTDHYTRELLLAIADPEFLNVVDQILEIVGGI